MKFCLCGCLSASVLTFSWSFRLKSDCISRKRTPVRSIILEEAEEDVLDEEDATEEATTAAANNAQANLILEEVEASLMNIILTIFITININIMITFKLLS